MDLTPLYDLRERLKTGAVAGTSLITEDFRLTRTLEAFAPFEAAAPIFAKLGQSVRNLISSECPNRAEALLDALSLCDAVLTTQATTAVSGTMGLLPATTGLICSDAPYSVLSPLLDALTSSGSGRYATVLDMHSQSPELFEDYRVKHAMVAALGASYAELADQVATWLSDEGPEMIPLLKQGFDPNGKKEMVRRVQVIEHIAGKSENEFYFSLLEHSDKEVKAAAVYALRHDEENAERLLNLAKTEKGTAKKMAHWAMAQLEAPIVWDYWNKMFEKNPEAAAEYMTLSCTNKSSAIIGKSLLAALEPLKLPEAMLQDDTYQTLQRLMHVLPGKSGASVCAYYEQAAALEYALDKPAPGQKESYLFSTKENYYTSEKYKFSQFIPVLLTISLVFYPTPDLLSLSDKLYQKHGFLYALPAITGALLTKNSNAAYKAAASLLTPEMHLVKSAKRKEQALQSLSWLLKQLRWEKDDPIPAISFYLHNPSTNSSSLFSRKFYAPLDPRWYLDAVKYQNTFTNFLMLQNWPEDKEVHQELSKFFYDICRRTSNNQIYLRPLKKLGWTNYEGFFKRYCENEKEIVYWSIASYLDALPISKEEKMEELEWVLKGIKEKKFKVRGTHTINDLQEQLNKLRSEN